MHYEVHFGEADGGRCFLLAEERDAMGGILAQVFDEVARLHEHPAQAASRIEHDAVVGLDDVHDGLHQRRRGEELAVVLRSMHRELQQKVLLDTSENMTAGRTERLAVEHVQQIFEKVVLELVVVFGQLPLQWLEVALDGVHRLDDSRAEVRLLGQLAKFVVTGFFGQQQSTTLKKNRL